MIVCEFEGRSWHTPREGGAWSVDRQIEEKRVTRNEWTINYGRRRERSTQESHNPPKIGKAVRAVGVSVSTRLFIEARTRKTQNMVYTKSKIVLGCLTQTPEC